MAGDLAQEVAAMRADLAAYGRGFELLASAVRTANEKLDLVLEAVTREPGPSPVQEVLERIARTLETQTAILERIDAATAPRPNGQDHS